jgi:hypothetical protein
LKRTSCITVLYNLDANNLRLKINELQDQIFEIIKMNNNINYFTKQANDNNFLNENLNGTNTMKSNSNQLHPMKSFKEINEEKEKIK